MKLEGLTFDPALTYRVWMADHVGGSVFELPGDQLSLGSEARDALAPAQNVLQLLDVDLTTVLHRLWPEQVERIDVLPAASIA